MLTDAKATPVLELNSGPQDEAQLLTLAETVGNMGHWYWHIQSNAMTWSDQVFSIFGRDPKSFEPNQPAFLTAIHPQDLDRIQNHFDQARSDGSSFEFDARIVTPAGAIRNIIAKGQPEADEDGNAVAVFGVVTDVTDAFRTLQAVRDQKELLDLAGRVSRIGHWAWDPDRSCLAFCSDYLAQMFDIDAGTMLNQIQIPSDFSQLIDQGDKARYEECVSQALCDISPYEIEYRYHGTDGIRHYREIGQPLIDDGGSLTRFIATVQDITEAKNREADLEKARKELEVLVEAKDQLFSIIGHDLKSPFNNIIGFASLLSSSTISLSPEKVQEYAGLILEAAENTNALLDTLLAWAAVESGDLPYRPDVLSIAETFADGIRPLTTLVREKGVAIESNFKNHQIQADRDMVLTVFRNLINNAIKFCESGDRIVVTAAPYEEAPDYVLIAVSDTGVGMDAAKLNAFIDGQRLQTTTGTSGETGSGLGLRICQNLVRRHGGNLWVESDPGKGCTVRFTMPTP